MCMLMCMCMLNKRTQILFSQSLWQTLTNLSIAKKVSVGKLVRDAVEKKYTKDQNLSSRIKAINNLLNLKKQYKAGSAKKENIADMVRRMRKERTEHMWNILEKSRKKSK